MVEAKQITISVKNALTEYGLAKSRVTDRYLPKDSQITVTFPTNTPKDTEAYVEVTPPTGYLFKIRYFIITTPLEVQANVLLTGIDGTETRMLKDNQAENLTDQLYDVGDWDSEAFFLQKFRLYVIVTGYDPTTDTTNPVTTADRQVILKYSGSIVKYQV